MPPKIKALLIYLRYLLIRYIKKRKYRASYLDHRVELNAVNDSYKYSSFFGYYNISPLNNDKLCLFGWVQTEKKRGSLESVMEINLRMSGNFVTNIAKTKSWNWQQGAMLQWYNESEVIYNDYLPKKDSYISKIVNIETGNEKILNKPIYSVSNDGKFALTLNYERLALMRPDYGYFNKKADWKDIPKNSHDGIWFIDIQEDDSKLILTLDQLKNYEPVSSMKGAKHKVNHIDIAPNGKRFMFLHRWVGPKGRFMRLITANCEDGSKLHMVTGNDMVSHNCWWGSEDIISFCRLENGTNRYAHFKDQQGYVEVIGDEEFNRDGHPSVSPNGRWMLTDEYPGLGRFSKLYMFDLQNKQKYLIGEFYQPLKFSGEIRVDLHPKWGPNGKFVSIDSAHTGKRQMYLLNIEEFLHEHEAE